MLEPTLMNKDIRFKLAVADAYDAMTSNRAYRPAMSEQDARDEMARVSGSQLDAEIVRQFTRVLTADAEVRS